MPRRSAVCATERARRCVVADSRPGAPDPRQAKFLEGPFVHGYNAAKYVAALLRARYVATEQKHMLLWVVAQDMPLFRVDPDEDAGHLEARKENWLQRHDQATGGIMGLLPLLPNMPVRITQTLPELKPLRLFKNSRGKLVNWCLQDADAEAVRTSTSADFVYSKACQSACSSKWKGRACQQVSHASGLCSSSGSWRRTAKHPCCAEAFQWLVTTPARRIPSWAQPCLRAPWISDFGTAHPPAMPNLALTCACLE